MDKTEREKKRKRERREKNIYERVMLREAFVFSFLDMTRY
jgi:hypothetical protein